MFDQIKDIVACPRDGMIEDTLGVLVLFVLLFAGLCLSGAA